MKRNLRYELLFDFMKITSEGKMEYRERIVVFRKGGIIHIACMITYVDIKKGKQPRLITLLTYDFDMRPETISPYVAVDGILNRFSNRSNRIFHGDIFIARAPTP